MTEANVFERILVPLDGSRFGEHALPRALSLASRWGAALELVMVATPQGGGQPQPGVVGDEARERGQALAESYLEDVEKRLADAGFDGEIRRTVVSPGNVANSLVRHLIEVEADFAVMTTHGRGPIQRAWLGSTADAFIRSSPVPVLLLRPTAGEAKDEGGDGEGEPASSAAIGPVPPPFSRILIPLDGSRSAERLLKVSRPLAGDDALTLLLRAVPAFTSGGSPY
ncbi:MAG: universal stress protein, partial [bacterium]